MAPQNTQHIPGKKEQVIANENRLLSAFKNRDYDSIDELLHEDLLFVIPTGQPITKAMDMEHIRSGHLAINSMSAEERVINLIGDTAVVTLILDMKGKYSGQDFEGKFRYLRVWKLFGNEWKVIAGSGMQLG